MKTCSVCGETYSERIDFCFNDGAVLQLMPSALDAPVPRMATAAQQEQAAAASRLRTGHTEEALVKAVETSSAVETPTPAASTEPAEPAALPADDEPETTEEQVPPVAEASPAEPAEEDTSGVAPAALSGSQPVPDDGGAAPVFDDVAAELGETPDDDRRVSPLLWLMGTAFLVAAVFLLAWVVKSTGASTPPVHEQPALTAPAAAPEPVEVPEPEPAEVAEPEPAEPPEPEEPVEAEAPAEEPAASEELVEEPPAAEPVSPEPAEETPPPAPRPRPTPRPRPAPAPAPAPAPTPEPEPEPPAAEATQASASPWDAPTQAQQATVSIVSDPTGATVRIDGVLKGRTPVDVPLAYGTYDLSLQLEGYQPVERRIDVASASPAFPHNLEPVVRQGNVLIIAAGWDGATLLVDGRRVGTLPAQVMLAEGAHTFEVRRAGERATDQRIVRLDDRGLTRITLDPK